MQSLIRVSATSLFTFAKCRYPNCNSPYWGSLATQLQDIARCVQEKVVDEKSCVQMFSNVGLHEWVIQCVAKTCYMSVCEFEYNVFYS